ncbi:MAG: hypothetical protein HZB26_19375 [Candidatus Hydrogenedentes bacterium]|nr:hypothetical protein [Candidatus Hydrogenedentota bacterium]
MNIKFWRAAILPIIVGVSMVTTSTAVADGNDGLRKIASRGLRSLKAGAPTRIRGITNLKAPSRMRGITNLNAPSRMRGITNLNAPSRSRGTTNHSPFRANSGQSLQNLGDLGNLLGYFDRSQRYRDSGEYGYPYDSRGYRDSDRAYADAYRDVGIANAVVGLVSTIVNSDANRVYSQPSGHYERVPVLVREGHYEETRVWVRDSYDPSARVESGHYEIQRRWIPEQYELRDVLVR